MQKRKTSRKKFLVLATFAVAIGAFAGYTVYNQLNSNTPAIKPTKKITRQESTKKPVAENIFNKLELSNDDPASIWLVVNKLRPLQPESYAPSDLVSVGNNQQLRQEAATALNALISDAKSAGLSISPMSGYRSYQRQVQVYGNEVSRYGQTTADTQSARPGTSEHQTGLSIDIGGGGCGIEDCFGNTKEGIWVAENAHKFGFIIRYPEGKQDITGYRYEPWHIRYIGDKLAAEMIKQKVTTLEEFFELPAAPNYIR